jgi:hypothetical protein
VTSQVSQLNGYQQSYYCQSLVTNKKSTLPFPHRSQPHGQASVARMANSKNHGKFPPQTIPSVRQPTYEAIKELHLKLNENAVKVHSNLGNGMLNYLGVTVTTAIYNNWSAQSFIILLNLGTAPVFPDHSTGPQITNIHTAFKDDFTAFKKYVDVCNAISSIILKVIDPVYLATLCLPYIGIGTCTPLQILAHLYTNYAKINPADLDNKDKAMKQPCDVNQPIKVL